MTETAQVARQDDSQAKGAGTTASFPLALEIGIQFGGGGEGRIIAELYKFLPGAGFRVLGAVAGPDNVSAMTEGRFLSFAPENGPKVARFRSARTKLINLLERERPDVIASHFALYALPALDRLRARPMVSHFHGPWGAESAQDGTGTLASSIRVALRILAERTVYSRANRVIVLSKSFAELATTRYGIDPALIRIVPGCVDAGRFDVLGTKAEARQRLGLPTDRPLLLSIRRLVKRMGLLELVQAMQEIVRQVPDALLLIGGRGLLREALEEKVATLGLSQHVRFLGYVDDDDLPYLYRAADINVVPTNALEGFGLVAAESLAAGTPSMVTRVGGLPDVVADLSQDLIFESSDPAVLAEGLISALLGRHRLPEAGACATYAQTHFNSALMAERTAAVYRELL